MNTSIILTFEKRTCYRTQTFFSISYLYEKNQYDKKGKYRISSFLTWSKLIIDRTLLQHSYSCVLIKINSKAKTDWQSLKYYFLFGWTIRKSFPDKYTQCKHVSSSDYCVCTWYHLLNTMKNAWFSHEMPNRKKPAIDILDNVGHIYIWFKNATTVMEF